MVQTCASFESPSQSNLAISAQGTRCWTVTLKSYIHYEDFAFANKFLVLAGGLGVLILGSSHTKSGIFFGGAAESFGWMNVWGLKPERLSCVG